MIKSAFLILSYCAICGQELFNVTICESFSEMIQCPFNTLIGVNDAFFGRANNNKCPNSYPQNSYNCIKNITFFLQDLCNGKSSCTVESSYTLYGDPCYSIGKYTEVIWTCYHNPLWAQWTNWSNCSASYGYGVVTRTRECNISNAIGWCPGNNTEFSECYVNQTFLVTICENLSKMVQCPFKTLISVNDAFFGRVINNNCPNSYPQNSYNCIKNITLFVQNLCDRKSSCIIESSYILYGDPCYSIGKYTEVVWTCYKNASWALWSNWSNCSYSYGYGVQTRKRECNVSNGNGWCFGNNTELSECNVNQTYLDNHIDSCILGFVDRSIINISVKLSGSGYNVTIEYFLPLFVTLVTEHVPYGFVNMNSNPNKYIFSGYFETKATHNITLNLNGRKCLRGFPIEIPVRLTYQTEMKMLKVKTMAYRKSLPCLDSLSPKIFREKNALKEYYGRGILVPEDKTYLYICMNQHVESKQRACYYSSINGDFMTGLDHRVGCVLGHHIVTKEIYAIHRNQKLYLYFNVACKKWLGLTNQEFQTISTNLDKSLMVNLEGDQDQIYIFRTYEWLGNADGLFYRSNSSSSWTLRIQWNR